MYSTKNVAVAMHAGRCMEVVMVIVSSDIKVRKSFVWSSIHELRGRVHMRAHLIVVVWGSIPLGLVSSIMVDAHDLAPP